MALNTITPSNREEEYLSAIAGDEGASAPVPSNRREEWLRRIAKRGEAIPSVPEAGDSGKVWTAGSDGTAGWENGGAAAVVVYPTTQPQTFADLTAPADGYHWDNDTTSYPDVTIVHLSLTPNGTPLTATELNDLIKTHTLVTVDITSGFGSHSYVTATFGNSGNVDLYSTTGTGQQPAPDDTAEAYFETRYPNTYFGIAAVVVANET